VLIKAFVVDFRKLDIPKNKFLEFTKIYFVYIIRRNVYLWDTFIKSNGPVSVVGIPTGHGLDGPGIESPWERLSAYVQAGPGAYPASCTISTGSFTGVKCGRGVELTTHPLLVSWSRKSGVIPLLPYGPYGLYRASVPVQSCILPFLPYKM
jgi:hypothetical protein